jgi:hypothetical protein
MEPSAPKVPLDSISTRQLQVEFLATTPTAIGSTTTVLRRVARVDPESKAVRVDRAGRGHMEERSTLKSTRSPPSSRSLQKEGVEVQVAEEAKARMVARGGAAEMVTTANSVVTGEMAAPAEMVASVEWAALAVTAGQSLSVHAPSPMGTSPR